MITPVTITGIKLDVDEKTKTYVEKKIGTYPAMPARAPRLPSSSSRLTKRMAISTTPKLC